MSTQTTAPSPTKVSLGPVRFSYANFLSPKADDQGAMFYGSAILIKKDNKKAIQQIEDAIKAALEAGKHSKKTGWGGKVPKSLKLPLRDGDDPEEKVSEDPVYNGHYFFNCKCSEKPRVVDRNLNEILEADEIYSGMYGYVSVNFYAFGGKLDGVAAWLHNVMKTKDGEPLTGSSTPAADFAGIEIEDSEDDLM